MISSLKKVINRKPKFLYLYKVSVFSAFLLCALALLGYLVDQGWRNSDDFMYKKWAMLYNPIEADLLIVGNSRACNHIDPFVMDSLLRLKTYNLGLCNGSYEYSEVVWRLYRVHNKKRPKLIVCNVDLIWLGNYPRIPQDAGQMPFIQDTCFNPITNDLPFVDFIPGMKYRENHRKVEEGLRLFFGFKERELDNLPYHTTLRDGAILVESDTMLGLGLNRPEMLQFEPGEKRIGMFNQLLDECLADSILVVLMKSPIHPTAYQHLSGVEESFALIDSLATARRLPLLDYTNYLIEDDGYFFNSTHLNYQGAQLLSVKLAEDIDSLVTLSKIRL